MNFSESEEENSFTKTKFKDQKHISKKQENNKVNEATKDHLLNSLAFKNKQLEEYVFEFKIQTDALKKEISENQIEKERLKKDLERRDEDLKIKDS